MAFVAEDGTGLPNSNAYGDVSGADDYFADRGVETWADLGTAEKQIALIKATDYIENRFNFLGSVYNDDQALKFPRVYLDASDPQMPANLLKAMYEYALRTLDGELAPDLEFDAKGLQVESKKEKVGPIEESTTYKTGASILTLRPYPAADMLLRDLIDTARRVIR